MSHMRSSLFSLMALAGVVSSLLLAGCSTPQSNSGKWEIVFNGSSTDALRGFKRDGFPARGWVVENGALKTVPRTSGGDVVDLITKEKYENFELELEWKVEPGGNSGFFYMVAETGDAVWHTGPEVQVLDDSRHPDGKNPKTSAGSLYALIAPSATKTLRPVGEFNKARLVVRGNHAEHWLNGVKIVEYEIGSAELQQLIAKSKFSNLPGFMKTRNGHIALQHHGEEAWFRNIRVRRLN